MHQQSIHIRSSFDGGKSTRRTSKYCVFRDAGSTPAAGPAQLSFGQGTEVVLQPAPISAATAPGSALQAFVQQLDTAAAPVNTTVCSTIPEVCAEGSLQGCRLCCAAMMRITGEYPVACSSQTLAAAQAATDSRSSNIVDSCWWRWRSCTVSAGQQKAAQRCARKTGRAGKMIVPALHNGTPALLQVLAEVGDLSIVSAFMQLAGLQGEYAQLTGTLFAARLRPPPLRTPAASLHACYVCGRVFNLSVYLPACTPAAMPQQESRTANRPVQGLYSNMTAVVPQPTNEAFRRAVDPELLARLLTANHTEDMPLLSKLLQFHSVPSPLPLAVSAMRP